MRHFPDVVNPQDLVVNDHFDEIEHSPDQAFPPSDRSPEPLLDTDMPSDHAVADPGMTQHHANGHVPRPTKPAKSSPKRQGRANGMRTPVPDNFVPTQAQRAWVATEVPGLDIERDTKKFPNYYRGTGDSKADWDATWRNWMYRAQDYQQPRRPPQQVGNDVVL